MGPQNQSQIDAKKIFRAGMVVLSFLAVAFLVWIESGNKLEIGQTKIWGGFVANGEILDLTNTPQGISFSIGGVEAEKSGYELESKGVGLRIWNTEFDLFLERWVEAGWIEGADYIIPQEFIFVQELWDKSDRSSDNKESSHPADPFR